MWGKKDTTKGSPQTKVRGTLHLPCRLLGGFVIFDGMKILSPPNPLQHGRERKTNTTNPMNPVDARTVVESLHCRETPRD